MPLPKYHVEVTDGGTELYSPTGELIISIVKTMGSEEIDWADHVGLDLDEDEIGNNHDKLIDAAAYEHQRLSTTRWDRFLFKAESCARHPIWSAVAAFAAVAAAIGIYLK